MSDSTISGLLRSIPAMDDLLNAPWAAEFLEKLGREQVKSIIAEALDGLRGDIRGGTPVEAPLDECAALRAQSALGKRMWSTLKRVVNATGVVVHTNLGRAPLAAEALRAAHDIAGVYSALEYSPEKGGRGERNAHVEWAVCRMTGAEAALVVNNNAAAALLALSATAAGREVIVSAGELVEIGASFRIPDILSFSGARMVAVGCTNATRIGDYENAITENTACVLKVHPSNYRIEGFVQSTPREELARLAASRNLVFMEDLGSGLLCPLNAPFADREPTVRDCLKAGSGVVTFSGDKLLGGPQIGVVAGSKPLIDKMKRHQLLRALRVDKMTLAAFDATLRLYLSGRRQEIPVVGMIEAGQDALLKKARTLRRILKAAAAKSRADYAVAVVQTRDAIGGGAYPTDELPGFGVAMRAPSGGAETLAAGLRNARIPVIPAIRDGSVVLHVRTLLPGDERIIAASFAEAVGEEGGLPSSVALET
ncbi:MAG: L-seryl-tRNA(Sec) selenium transferase [Spirochaetaceae bacterium]|jgi:L-seryl-tRNA(Ser) seleniumtransferase|nr:L-seryl-tRNA(Sec) selenium transferase [Spirochaetaceae bacterium]